MDLCSGSIFFRSMISDSITSTCLSASTTWFSRPLNYAVNESLLFSNKGKISFNLCRLAWRASRKGLGKRFLPWEWQFWSCVCIVWFKIWILFLRTLPFSDLLPWISDFGLVFIIQQPFGYTDSKMFYSYCCPKRQFTVRTAAWVGAPLVGTASWTVDETAQ